MRNSKASRIALCGLLLALTLVLGYVESLLPISSAVPGVKLGLQIRHLLHQGQKKRLVLDGFRLRDGKRQFLIARGQLLKKILHGLRIHLPYSGFQVRGATRTNQGGCGALKTRPEPRR